MKNVEIYTDGACRGNPGVGGWGAVLKYGNFEREISGGEASTTNNRMELTAVISALSLLKEPCHVTLTSDSKYVIDAIQKGWLDSWQKKGWRKSDGKEVLNIDLWKKVIALLEIHSVDFVWVHGHTGHKYNERCDELATTYADKIAAGEI